MIVWQSDGSVPDSVVDVVAVAADLDVQRPLHSRRPGSSAPVVKSGRWHLLAVLAI